jgi:undecaprenyl pyrophosphate phosphatase UppP
MKKYYNSPAFIAVLFFYGSSLMSFGFGLHKMNADQDSESVLLKSVNAYVGGDAYNYIINANLSTSFYVFAFVLAFIGFLIQWNHIQDLSDALLGQEGSGMREYEEERVEKRGGGLYSRALLLLIL